MTFSTVILARDNRGVGIAFTDRFGGVSPPPLDSLNLGRSDVDDPANLSANFRTVSDLIGVDHIAICSQVHGNHVEQIGGRDGVSVAARGSRLHPDDDPGQDQGAQVGPDHSSRTGQDHGSGTGQDRVPVADAMVTTVPGVALAIRVADCVPVLLADPGARVVAAAHAGRVGLLSGVLQNTVAAMRALGARHIQAWMGPHICAACYEVPPDMAGQAWQQIPATRALSRESTPALDLGAGAEAILRSESIPVVRCDPCTSCDPRFFSHRRDHGQTGRQAGLIWFVAP